MNIKIKLLHNTPIQVLINAIRTCYDSNDKSDSTEYYDPVLMEQRFSLGNKDKALIERIVESGHGSVLEHITFNFQIKGISRLNLQELARHRIASLSVKSTRYTLKELKGEEPFVIHDAVTVYEWERASKYINFLGIEEIDTASITTLENLRRLTASGKYKNDEVKYSLGENYKLDLIWTINLRSLLNFLNLRDSDRAHFEIRETAQKIIEEVPQEFQFILDLARSLQ